MEGQEGEGKGEEGASEKEGRGRKGERREGEEGYPLRIKSMAAALLLIISTLLGWIVTPRLVIFGVPPHGAAAKIQNSASEKFCSQTHRIYVTTFIDVGAAVSEPRVLIMLTPRDRLGF